MKKINWKNINVAAILVVLFTLTTYGISHGQADTIPPTDQELKKLQLEIERLKLENEQLRLQKEIEAMESEEERLEEEAIEIEVETEEAEEERSLEENIEMEEAIQEEIERNIEMEMEISEAERLADSIRRDQERREFFEGGFSFDRRDFDFFFNKRHSPKFRFLLIDLGISSWTFDNSLNLPADLDDFNLKYPGSYTFNLHIFRHRLPLIKHWLHFEYGTSINFRQYKFENNRTLTPEIQTLELQDNGIDYNVNKLRTSYIEFPLMLTVQPRNSKFHFSAGIYYGLRIGSNLKLKSDEFGKEVIKDDFNLRSTTTGGILRLGFGPVEFYTQLGAESIFKEDIDTELVPVTFGIAILGF